jgi:tRNA A-37 threonylcarbamoyl transferase component Bud32
MAEGTAEVVEPNRVLAGRYRLLSQIGRGGMGAVWRARDEILDRDVAIKEVLIHAGLSDTDRAILHERTQREARATARLNHPGIVTVHDVVEEDGRPWIVMELVPAASLQDILDREGPVPWTQAAEIGRQMLSALRTAHAAGILHRDVKPANVLLLRDGAEVRAILTDFGLAQMTGDVTLTQTGLVMGSPAYIAPERALGEKAEATADLWALGATLYAATEGKPPHDRTEAMAALAAVLMEDPKPPANAGPLAPIIMALLSRETADRPAADVVAEQLTGLLRGTVASPTVRHAVPADAIATSATPPPPPFATAPFAEAPVHGYGEQQGFGEQHGYGEQQGFGEQHGSAETHGAVGYGPTAGSPMGYGGTPGDGRPARRGSGTRTAIIAVVVALMAAVAGVGAYLWFGRDSGTSPSASRTSAPAVPNGNTRHRQPAKTPGKRGSSLPIPLPRGLTREAGLGFTIGVPTGYVRSSRAAETYWRDPATAEYVQVDQIQWTDTPMRHWQQWQLEVMQRNTLRNFRPLGIRPAPVYGAPGAQASDDEYTWTGAGGVLMHGLDRGIALPDGRHFAILVAVPDSRWAGRQAQVEAIVNSFRPN